MKNTTLLLLVAALAAPGAIQAKDKSVEVTDLPAAVQRTLTEASRGEPVKKIQRRVVDGLTVFDVELERNNAVNPRLRIAEDGRLISSAQQSVSETGTHTARSDRDGRSVTPSPSDSILASDQLPPAVRETVKQQAAGREIADIDRETWQGRTVYEVEFKSPGLNPQVHIAEDGTVVKPEQTPGAHVGAGFKSIFMGTQLEDTPTAVQETIRREAGNQAIKDIDLERRDGQRVYEVDIGEGLTKFRIHIAENGRILNDTRRAGTVSAVRD
ncbi:MAG: PepSY-like domain-containing protein [Opitutaceae bacterium]|nr:PepSY-like domain-containing protein [Opitutaceae bacterium]